METGLPHPENEQWESIERGLGDLAAAVELNDDETVAVYGHFSPQKAQSSEGLETGLGKLRSLFEEWRRASPEFLNIELPPAAANARLERQMFERTVMINLLGRPSTSLRPVPFHALIEGKSYGQLLQLTESVESVLAQLNRYVQARHITRLREVMGNVGLAAAMAPTPDMCGADLSWKGPSLFTDAEAEALEAYLAVAYHPLLTADQEKELGHRIQAGRLPEESATRFTPDAQAAREVFVVHNLRLVTRIAFFYITPRQALSKNASDIIQVGNEALIKCVDKFDPNRGTKFSTYATWYIRGAIRRYIAQEGRHMTGDAPHVQSRVALVHDAYEHTSAHDSDVTLQDVGKWQGYGVAFLRSVVRDAADDYASEGFARVEDDMERQATIDQVQQMWKELRSVLSPREFDVIWRRQKLGHSAIQIARDQHVSRQAINVIQKRAWTKIRSHHRVEVPKPRSPEALIAHFGIGRTEQSAQEQAAELLSHVPLDEKIRRILLLRFCVEPGAEPATRAEIGHAVGMTAAMVKYYEEKGIEQIKQFTRR